MRVRRLTPRDVAAYREIMLEGYGEAPEAFTATVEERRDLPLDWWAPRVSDAGDADRMVFGALVGDELVGVAGLRFERQLTVTAGDQPAIWLYESFGFRVVASEPLALRMDGDFVEMLHMWRRVEDRPASERMGS